MSAVFGAAAWWSLFAAWSRAKTAGSAAFRGVILTGLPLLLIALTSTAPASPPERPPNIILIVTDDLGVTDLGVYGSDYHLTPQLNALAQEGMRFSSAYAASPVCSPTRAAILTGRSPHRLHLTDALPWDRLPDNPRLVPPNHWKELSALHATYAKHLRAAGYRTALYGKWHLGNEYDFFTQGRHRSYGFDEVFDASSSDINNVDKGVESLTERALAFIERNSSRPFLLALHHHTPHVPLATPAQYEILYDNIPAGERHKSKKYAGMMSHLDDAVGRVLDKLEDLNLDGNTLVVFTSDNGGTSGQTSNLPYRDGKATLYEGGIRVPLLVRWPGQVAPGTVSDAVAMSTDLFPTFLEAAGLPLQPDAHRDGQSLMPRLRGESSVAPRAVYWHVPHYRTRGPQSAVRDGNWKLVHNIEANTYELYDLANDPGEATNLASAQPGLTDQLAAKLATHLSDSGAQGMVPNPGWNPDLPNGQVRQMGVFYPKEGGTVQEVTDRPYPSWFQLAQPAALGAPVASPPVVYFWDGGGATTGWGNATNWVGDVAPAFINDTILVFDTNVGTADTLFIGAQREVRGLTFGANLTGGADNVFDIQTRTGLNGAATNLLLNGGATNASITLDANTTLSRVRLGSGNVGAISFQTTTDLFQNSPGTVLQFDGSTTGAGSLNKHGIGTVTFTRANSFNGLNLYGGGAVVWNNAAVLGTNSVTLGEAGSTSNVSLFVGSGLTYTNAITVSSGSGNRVIANTHVTNQLAGFTAITGNPTLSGGIDLSAGQDVTLAITNYNATTDRLTLSGAITGTGRVIKTGNGVLVLSNTASTHSGDTVIEQGNIQTTATNSFSSASVLKFGANTNSRRLQLQGRDQTLGGVDDTAVTGGILIVEAAADNVSNAPATLTLNVAAGINHTYSGYVRNAAGTATNSALTLVKNGAGTQVLSGPTSFVSYSGGTTVNDGVLEFSGTNSVANNSAITLGGGTVRFSGGGTRSNTISGTGNLEKTGTNTLVLAGTNSYAGTTRVLGGALLITGDSSAATGSLMVSPGATFGGSGQFGGDVWFDVGARLPFTLGVTLTLAPVGQVSFAGLNPIDISGLGLATAAGTYRLVDGTVGPSVIAALGEANAVHYGLRSKAWFELTNGLVLRVVEKSLTLPEVFPINMGFKTLLSTTNDPNNLFDTLANAGRYAIHHGNVSNVDQIKQAFPQVMTIAMNPRQTDGENRSQNVGDTNTGNVWPGFFLYRAGSRLISDIDASVTQIPVEDASRFTTRDYAVLSSLNAQGRPEFLTSAATGSGASYEIVNVTGVDTNSNTLTVVRGQTGTTTKAFAAGASAALPFREAWQIDNKITIIRPNFSLNAPRHPVTGENGAELWGRGRGLAVRDGLNDGTEQDIVSCLAGDRVDTDLNLVPDGGFADGINVWSLGWQEHVAIVRGIIGPNRILQHDCTRPSTGYRGWRYVNGIQIEAFGKGQDFSENFDLLAQWVQYADVQPAFSYGYCREPTTTYGGVQPDNDWLFRKQFAAGLMVGMPHPYGSGENFGLFDWDEQRGGELDDYAWLGRALGPFERDFSGMGTTDLLAGGSWSVVTAAGFAATHSGSPSDPEGIEIHVNQIPPLLQGDPVYSGVMLKWNSAALDLQRGAEYTLVFEARASDSITYNGKTYDGLPGLVRVRDFDGTIARFNFLVPGGWRTYYMSYVVPESGGNARFNGSFQLGEEAQRTFRLRNIRLYTGTADRLKREFENGVVLLNESQVTPWTATLGSGQHRRLKGNIRPDINTGATVTGSVNVPARDAVYLLKPTYANWAKERGLDMDSGTGAGMSDDPDADGIPNLMEWVLAGHPLTPNTARPAALHMENGVPVFQFERTLQSKEAVACHVEYTTDLRSTEPWARIPVDGPSPPGVTITREDLGDGTERIRVALAPGASDARLFVRLVAVAGP